MGGSKEKTLEDSQPGTPNHHQLTIKIQTGQTKGMETEAQLFLLCCLYVCVYLAMKQSNERLSLSITQDATCPG